MTSLMSSMCLVLDEFYENLRTVGVSAMTGAGMSEFFQKVQEAREEWETEYRPEVERKEKEKADKKEKDKAHQLERLMKDLSASDSKEGSTHRGSRGAGSSTQAGSGVEPSANPFGPHGMNEREDRWYDEEGGQDEDEEDLENDDEFGPDADREAGGTLFGPGSERGDVGAGMRPEDWARPV